MFIENLIFREIEPHVNNKNHWLAQFTISSQLVDFYNLMQNLRIVEWAILVSWLTHLSGYPAYSKYLTHNLQCWWSLFLIMTYD